jgi:HprK-related kinase A
VTVDTRTSLADLPVPQLRKRLAAAGVRLQIGPFRVCVHSDLPELADTLSLLYAAYPLLPDEAFCDFHVAVDAPGWLRRIWRPQVVFDFDGTRPFKPLPRNQAFALFEWGLNWCVAAHALDHLIVHAAVLERDGRALVLPGRPGAGKSTLAAALALSGFRLLSDEMALISLGDGLLQPIPRPVSLKDTSIDIIRAFAPGAVIGPPAHDTAKGTVAHLRVPEAAVQAAMRVARPGFVVFPHWQDGAVTTLETRGRARSLFELAEQSFNYDTLGPRAMHVLAPWVEGCECFDFRYSRLDEAVETFTRLFSGETVPA